MVPDERLSTFDYEAFKNLWHFLRKVVCEYSTIATPCQENQIIIDTKVLLDVLDKLPHEQQIIIACGPRALLALSKGFTTIIAHRIGVRLTDECVTRFEGYVPSWVRSEQPLVIWHTLRENGDYILLVTLFSVMVILNT